MSKLTEEELDFGRQLLLDVDLQKELLAENSKEISQWESPDFGNYNRVLESGISIIIATYDGASRIGRVLESLANQTLNPQRYEVVCVVNGKDNGTSDVIREYQQKYPDVNIRQFWSERGSAGAARNLGLDLARFSRITFVDDDDDVQPRFLEVALKYSTGINVVLLPIFNVSTSDGSIDEENTLNQRIQAEKGKDLPLASLPWALGFNACKLFPRAYARQARYNEDLKSGEDLVYFAELLRFKEMKITIPDDMDQAAYLRYVRDDSVSRQNMTFNFAVEQRLACIKALEAIDVQNPAGQGAIHSLKVAQAGFIGNFIKEKPKQKNKVLETIETSGIRDFPWYRVHDEIAEDLAFVYCFAPFADTSAVVAAKAIVERQRVTDVITNDMSTVRSQDKAVSALADRWIADRTMVKAHPSFAGWKAISEFAEQAVEIAEQKHAQKPEGYKNIYSRALWIGSHVAAVLFKNKHWNVHWTAEFSDPLRRDAEGNARPGELFDNAISEYLKTCIGSRGFGSLPVDTLFDLVELATLVTADELIFTNQNQMDYMLSLYDDQELTDLVRAKSTVRHHPTPPAYAYDLFPTSYKVAEDAVNIAYFGTFYENRGIGDVFQALLNAPQAVRNRVRLHVFSNKPDEVADSAKAFGLGPNIISNPYLSYMEFLSATKLFDILLVNDVERSVNLPVNPFLPSKYSDYLGSGRKIFALVDDGSPLTKIGTDYMAPVGNVPKIIRVLETIVSELG